MRFWLLARLLLAAWVLGIGAHVPAVLAAWSSGSVSLCGSHCGDFPMIATDGAGGAFVVWRYYPLPSGGNSDLYMQNVTVNGETAPGWPADLPVCTDSAIQDGYAMTADGLGGAIVAWSDFRNANPDIYAQRILADGTIAPGWEVNGVPVTHLTGYQNFPVVLADGAGGVYVSWTNVDYYRGIYLQHLTATGQPAPGWPADGLPICTLPSIRAQRFAADGPVPVRVSLVSATARLFPRIAADAQGRGRRCCGRAAHREQRLAAARQRQRRGRRRTALRRSCGRAGQPLRLPARV